MNTVDTYVYVIVTAPDGRIVLHRTKLRSYSSHSDGKGSVQISEENMYSRWKATITHKIKEEDSAIETAERAIYVKLGIKPKECHTFFCHMMSYGTKFQKVLEIYKFQLKSGVQLLLSGAAETRCLLYEDVVKMMEEDVNEFTGDTIDVMNVSSCFIT